MDEERLRFKAFIMKYESELHKTETKTSDLLTQNFSVSINVVCSFIHTNINFCQYEQKVQILEMELRKVNEEYHNFQKVKPYFTATNR
jgi:hypothetical protein